ncbi:FAD-binding monooxygenase moxY [Pseudocercospora fuligena]|uniref:FAD-binding monooxygenase moxY n=1 Tax=Pseudocercospora fuligena TaxID=685502 RepID=A0A8H6VP38_9PEZI|nr:FAD-binding monooxygenase moxY [Pseudocercospora fuligena]
MSPFIDAARTSLASDGEVPQTDVSTEIPVHTGNGNTTTKTNGTSSGSHAIPLNTDYAYTPRKIRVVTIGAGFSGLLIAHKFQHRFPELRDIVDHTIFEAKSDLGGTWLMNDYPGVQCDVPSHIYAFPFDPNPNWSRFYSSGAEIEAYIKRTAKKWNLDRDVQLNTTVVGAHWNESKAEWKITVEHKGEQREEFCDVLISSQGVLTHPSWPSVPGLDKFKGHTAHSAQWDHDFDYSNKRIAVIGNGSSGIQIVPQMQKLPGTTVRNFIRGPAWVYYRLPPSRHLGRDVDDPNPPYLEEEIQRWQDPVEHNKYRKGIIDRRIRLFDWYFLKGENNSNAVKLATEQMREKLNNDPDLCEKLIPKWELGCRRVTPGPGYLESFSQPNCSLTNSPITEVTEKGIVTADGETFECDVIICATGFDVSHRPRYPLVGQNDINLRDKWEDEPESYLSIGVDSFPNYFIMMGPNCLGGHGSLVESLNWTGDYFAKMIKKISTEDIKYVVPKASAVDAFVKYGDEVHKTLAWSGSCKSWYKRNRVDGRVTALFGGSAVLFHRLMQEIRMEDYEVVYNSGNPFRFMGNGFLEWEMRPDSDLSWYVEVVDREPKIKETENGAVRVGGSGANDGYDLM